MSNKKTILERILFPSKSVDRTILHNSIKNKAILITGASYGIGEATAQMLAKESVTLILVARSADKLEQIKTELEQKGAVVHIFTADLYDISQVEKLLECIKELPCTIDLFINNAGKSIYRSIENSLDRFHDFTRTMSLNYYTPVRILLTLIPQLIASRGQIINISAINVLFAPAPHWAAYQASKSAMDNWFRSAMPELNAKGVATTSIYLPLVRTRMIEPTTAYNNAPAMLPQQAATLICMAIVKRNRKWKPWWCIFPQIGSVLFRRQWEAITTYYIKKKKNA